MSTPDPSLPPEVRAIRTATAMSRGGTTQVVRLRGDGARAAALGLLPSRLQLRDAQGRQSLLLDPSGRPIADVLVFADDEDFLLLVDGLDGPALAAHLAAHARGADIEDLSATHEVLSLHGPWAWELVAEVLGADLVALPYLDFFRIDGGFCMRAGRTGEYGYEIVVTREEMGRLLPRVRERGADFDLCEIGADTLSVAMMESWFFDPAHVPPDATPVELQLDWRLVTDRPYVGREAVDRRRATATLRQACLLAEGEIARGEPVVLGGRQVGTVTRAVFSHVRGSWIASALVDRTLAHGGIDLFDVEHAGARVPVLTVAPPLVDNRSLYVDPRRHLYRARDEIAFGPLVRPPRAALGARRA